MMMADVFVKFAEFVTTDIANILIAISVIFSATVAALATMHTYYFYKLRISKHAIINKLRENIKGTEEIKKFLWANTKSSEFYNDNDLKSVIVKIDSLEQMFKDFETSINNDEFENLYKQMEEIRLVIKKIRAQLKNTEMDTE
jgi:hypothetical protein